MIIKRMFKFTLPALLLAAGVTAYAAGEGPILLKDGETAVTWTEFAKAINTPSSLGGGVPTAIQEALEKAQGAYDDAVEEAAAAPTRATEAADAATKAKEAYDKADGELDELNEQLAGMSDAQKFTTKTAPWLQGILTSAQKFDAQYSQAYWEETITGTTTYIWCKITSNLLYVSFVELSGYTRYDAKGFYEWFATGLKFKKAQVQLYLGNKYVDEDDELINEGNLVTSYGGDDELIISGFVTSLQNLVATRTYIETSETTAYTTLKNKIAAKKTEVASLKTAYDDATAAEKAANAAVNTAQAAVTTTKIALDKAQADYDKAETEASTTALANYKEVTLTEDVTVDAMINSFDGDITGNGHIISLGDGVSSVFKNFSGTLVEVAVNGKFSTANNNATFNSVANWNGDNTGVYYDADGVRTGNIGTLGQLGFMARENFGVDFTTGKLVALTDASKVYNITIYDGPESTVQHYVQVKGDKFISAKNLDGFTIPVNMFAKSESTDLKGFANVFYKDNTCEKVVIKDREAFYCPVEIVADEIDYSRTFTTGQNVTCLPFELKYDYVPDGTDLCKYDRETADKFYFSRVEQSIPANTPVLVRAIGDFKLEGVAGTIKATPKDQIVERAATNDKSQAYGTFKKTGVEEFRGKFDSYKVYGLTTDKRFQPAAVGAVFPAFRMVIFSGMDMNTTQQAPRRIVIVDENGVELTEGETTGIEGIESDVLSFNVAGGQGEIVITSEADYGTVPVYAIDGKLVAQADVVAGTTTVNVQKGIYIVMGKKILVK